MDKLHYFASNRILAQKKKNNHRNENFEKHVISEAETMEFGRKRWTSYGVLSVDPFRIQNLHQFKRNWILAQKKWAPKRKFLKNAISKTEMIEFGWKTMIL